MIHCCLALAMLPPAAQSDELSWRAHRVTLRDGRVVEGERTSLVVPEDHGRPDGPAIELAFARYRCTGEAPGAPIFFLAGGPGGSGIEGAAELAADPRLSLLEHHDLIGIDQRGVGLSRPKLSAGPEFAFELPLDEVVTRDRLAGAFGEALERCAAHWKDQGVDLGCYDSVQSADDVDAIRRALGLEEIILWGSSYGSHLGLSVLRRHAAKVERAVLCKVEGPDQTFKLPSLVQARLERLDELLDDEPEIRAQIPDVVGLVFDLLAQLEEEPVRLEMPGPGGSPMTLALGPLDLQMVVSNALGDTGNLSGLPMALHAMSTGEWRPLARVALGNRRGQVGSAMTVAMDLASGISDARRQRLEDEIADEELLLGDAINGPLYPELRTRLGVEELDDDFRGPLPCEVPVLFVSGELDARTPPENVIEIADTFPRHAHVLLSHTGHDARELESEEFTRLVRSFLAGEEVEDCRIELPPIRFRPLRRAPR